MFSVDSHRGKYTVDIRSDIPDNEFEDSFLLVDSKVLHLYPHLSDLVDKSRLITISAFEHNKTLHYCTYLINSLVERGFKRNNNLVAVGGGVTQDVTSFVASILFRGVEWRFIPTTLLAQADSCIGSKTSINVGDVKNVIGTFYPPTKIWCVDSFLQTLAPDDIKCGIGEILHYYLIADHPSAKIISESTKHFHHHIKESLLIKKPVVERDEFDTGERRIFNYGHTFGHAIEVISNYKINHGMAVTLGMHIANYVAHKLDLIDKKDYDYLQGLIEFNLPSFSVDQVDSYMELLKKDKKNTTGVITCVLPHGRGDMRVTPILDLKELKIILEHYFFWN